MIVQRDSREMPKCVCGLCWGREGMQGRADDMTFVCGGDHLALRCHERSSARIGMSSSSTHSLTSEVEVPRAFRCLDCTEGG